MWIKINRDWIMDDYENYYSQMNLIWMYVGNNIIIIVIFHLKHLFHYKDTIR